MFVLFKMSMNFFPQNLEKRGNIHQFRQSFPKIEVKVRKNTKLGVGGMVFWLLDTTFYATMMYQLRSKYTEIDQNLCNDLLLTGVRLTMIPCFFYPVFGVRVA